MSFFKQDHVDKIKSEFTLINSRYVDIKIKLWELHNRLKTEKAKEYLSHGVMRRLGIMMRSIKNVFTIFPIERNTLLSTSELSDVDINLHAFIVNIFGLLDNLAWVWIHEKQLANEIHQMNVGLYKTKTQKHLTEEFCRYLNSDRMKKWYNEYLRNYRDTLSHRIPLYVLPKALTPKQVSQVKQIENKIADCYKLRNWDMVEKLREESDRIGDVCFLVSHASSENFPIILHAQLIADFNTIEEIVKKYCEMFLE
ncbi:MAG: hypothetical protein JRC91_11855 [Deltaproteobacteria bacterium]|nr:hypothetical protein [Deltaproteobacteria bacterium]